MEALTFASGLRSYGVDGGVLTFHPGDPGVLSRFLSLGEKLSQLQPRGETDWQKWQDADSQCRALLEWVFPGNDFKVLLGQVNLLSACENGQSVLANLLQALTPVLEEGMRGFARQTAAALRAQ